MDTFEKVIVLTEICDLNNREICLLIANSELSIYTDFITHFKKNSIAGNSYDSGISKHFSNNPGKTSTMRRKIYSHNVVCISTMCIFVTSFNVCSPRVISPPPLNSPFKTV